MKHSGREVVLPTMPVFVYLIWVMTMSTIVWVWWAIDSTKLYGFAFATLLAGGSLTALVFFVVVLVGVRRGATLVLGPREGE